MPTRYALADHAGLVIHCGPARTFPTKTDAYMMLMAMPCEDARRFTVVPVDGEFSDVPTPTQPRMPS